MKLTPNITPHTAPSVVSSFSHTLLPSEVVVSGTILYAPETGYTCNLLRANVEIVDLDNPFAEEAYEGLEYQIQSQSLAEVFERINEIIVAALQDVEDQLDDATSTAVQPAAS